MDQPLTEQREKLYADYEYLVKHFLFCYNLIKCNPKELKIVLKRWDKEVARNYNIEIIIALLLIKWFSAYSPEYHKPLSNGALITIRWIAFDENCPYHIKWNKKLLEIMPDDYVKCYYPKRRTRFDMSHFKNTSFHKLAQYVPYDMFFDYMGRFLEQLEYYSLWPTWDKVETDYIYEEFFHKAFVEFINTLRIKASNIRSLEKIHQIKVKPRKETAFSTTHKKIKEEEIQRSIAAYEEHIKGTPADDGDPLWFYDFIEADSDFWVWKSLCDSKLDDILDNFHERVWWSFLELTYEIQELK